VGKVDACPERMLRATGGSAYGATGGSAYGATGGSALARPYAWLDLPAVCALIRQET